MIIQGQFSPVLHKTYVMTSPELSSNILLNNSYGSDYFNKPILETNETSLLSNYKYANVMH